MAFTFAQVSNRTFWYLSAIAFVAFVLVNVWTFTHPHSQMLYAIVGFLVSLMFIAANWRLAVQRKQQQMQDKVAQ